MEAGNCESKNPERDAAPVLCGELPYLRHFARVGPERPGGTATALYIRERPEGLSARDFVTALGGEFPLKLVRFDGRRSDERAAAELIAVLQEGGWAVLDLRADPGPRLLSALIAFDRRQAVTPEARLVVFADRELIEERITYPRFYQIFGMLRCV